MLTLSTNQMLFSSALEDLYTKNLMMAKNRIQSKTYFPAINVIDQADKWVIELIAPGLRKEDFNIVIEKNALNVNVVKEKEIENQSQKYTRIEFQLSSFSRSFVLPESADIEHIEADYNNGILSIQIPTIKAAAAQLSKKIEVQ